jgi:ABC-type taurine transport system ATPase subunit
MTALLQFNTVNTDQAGGLSFGLMAGELRVLQVATAEAKAAVIDLILGEAIPADGEILLLGQPLTLCKSGNIGWIAADGGLISNLKAWENITLPLWYHGKRQAQATEKLVARWLNALEMDKDDWERFMASPAARLNTSEHKIAGLMRGLVQAPQLMLVDALLFEEVDAAKRQSWIAVLEKFVQETGDRALLVVACNATTLLPWKSIE